MLSDGRNVPTVVGTNHYSNKITTTTTQQPLQIHLTYKVNAHTTFLDPTPSLVATTIINLGTSPRWGYSREGLSTVPQVARGDITVGIIYSATSGLRDHLYSSHKKSREMTGKQLQLYIPVFKKGSCVDPSNYRPISLMCMQLLERIVYLFYLSILLTTPLILSARNNTVSEDNIRMKHNYVLEAVNDLASILNAGCQTEVDFTKAFDKVSHIDTCSTN